MSFIPLRALYFLQSKCFKFDCYSVLLLFINRKNKKVLFENFTEVKTTSWGNIEWLKIN